MQPQPQPKSDQEISQILAKRTKSPSQLFKSLSQSSFKLKEKIIKQTSLEMREVQEQDQTIVKPLPELIKPQTEENSPESKIKNSCIKEKIPQRNKQDILDEKIIQKVDNQYQKFEKWIKNAYFQNKRLFIVLSASFLVLVLVLLSSSFKICSLSNQINILKKQLNDIKEIISKDDSQIEIRNMRNQFQVYMKITNSMLYNADQSLTLGRNISITDKRDAIANKKTIEYLSSLKNAQLKYLYLWNNQLFDSDIESIFRATWFNQIKALQLNKNELTDQIINLLIQKKRPNLVWLNISKNKISAEGIMKFIDNAHMFPNLKYFNYVSQSIKDIYKIHLKMKEMLPHVNFVKQE